MFKERFRLAAAIFAGSVVLHVLSAAWGQAGGGRGRVGVLGGANATAQTAPCTYWEVRTYPVCVDGSTTSLGAGWEPFGLVPDSGGSHTCHKPVLRRCVAH